MAHATRQIKEITSIMPSHAVDAIVLGAGIVGVSAALALQARGRTVALIDRLPEAAGETSFGNSGIVQTEGVLPYLFPRSVGEVARAAVNRDPRAHMRHGALPSIAPSIWRYFQASTPARKAATGKVMAPLLFAAAAEHLKLAQDSGASGLLRAGGWIKAYRSARGQDAAHAEAEELKAFGVKPVLVDRAGLTELEPHVGEKAIGGVHYTEPLSTSDPAKLIQSYAALFVQRGGRMERGDALSLEPSGSGWMVTTDAGRLAARDVIIALGPWSDELARRLGLRLPFFVKRGYHMHYEAKGNAGLTRPVLDVERGYLVTPMARGLRLTTGAEFARRDDPASPAHLERVEPYARELFPIGARKDAAPWLGRRPCLPDMRPVIGPFPGKPGLWLDFGHHHLGLTLGPITGRLMADLVTGATPFVDPAPFKAERFGT
jgi:D-amino-acid dehydrogenase